MVRGRRRLTPRTPGLREKAAGDLPSRSWLGHHAPLVTPHLPVPHLAARAGSRSRYVQWKPWTGPGLSCVERTFQEAASGTRGFLNAGPPEPGCPDRPRPRPDWEMNGPRTESFPASLHPFPPPICFPSQPEAITWAGKGPSGKGAWPRLGSPALPEERQEGECPGVHALSSACLHNLPVPFFL